MRTSNARRLPAVAPALLILVVSLGGAAGCSSGASTMAPTATASQAATVVHLATPTAQFTAVPHESMGAMTMPTADQVTPRPGPPYPTT